MTKTIKIFTLAAFLVITNNFIIAQKTIPNDRVIKNDQLQNYLTKETKAKLLNSSELTDSVLALHFRNMFSERYFYNWENVEEKFEEYKRSYNKKAYHETRAKDHLNKFNDSTVWLLPFNYKNEKEVNAYAYRHLSRQHKMVDIAYQYFYSNKDSSYISYFKKQLRSLNFALENDKYEKVKDGNGVYEAFRSGYRILNWLSIHNLFLGEEAYSDEDQLLTIATLLQHGAHLYKNNTKYNSGNHQTRGMSALAMLSILLRDFEGTDKWYERAMLLLGEHLSKEINPDGFQFERAVQYHLNDIINYFYVLQLAKISGQEVNKSWEDKLKSLFSTVIKFAYPNKTAPVLQDDAGNAWAEFNNISSTATLGYLLFEDPVIGYFAKNKIEDKLYWFFSNKDLKKLDNIKKEKPTYGSLSFPDTKYYIMREGWNANDKMMIISAGVDENKPDHQHGDVLGIQAIANSQYILPNYQVRYPLEDYKIFKNSLVKNVALVDDELQGKIWTSNSGNTGFGKFANLPTPKTISWETNDDYDLFVGSHNGFENVGVSYSRQVIYVKNDFWIVKDNFSSSNIHTYKQVWQGHYTTEEGPNLIRSTFSDATGCDILQLLETDNSQNFGRRGKGWNIVSKEDENNFSFITVIFPYLGYGNRLSEDIGINSISDWDKNSLSFQANGKNVQSLSKNNKSFIFNVNHIEHLGSIIKFNNEADVFLYFENGSIFITSIGARNIEVSVSTFDSIELNGNNIDNTFTIEPNDFIKIGVRKYNSRTILNK